MKPIMMEQFVVTKAGTLLNAYGRDYYDLIWGYHTVIKHLPHYLEQQQ